MPVAPLPDLDTLDAAALRDMVVQQQAQLSSRDEELERLHEKISSHAAEVERLRLVIARLQRLQFGRKSEKIQRQLEQLELQLEDLEARTAEERQQTGKTLPPTAAIRKPARRALPEHLPREVETHIPQHTSCPACGGELSRLGEDVSEVLEYVPARFQVIRHVRPKLSCTKCDVIVQAEAPSRPIERGLAGTGLLAHVLVSKYADILPLYRQAEIYAREGVELERSTLADWVGGVSELLKPLQEALRQYVMNGRKLHADDTPVPVLAPGDGTTKLGRLWTYVRDDRPAGGGAGPGGSIHIGIWRRSTARCRRMRMLASTGCMIAVASEKPLAGRTCGASSSICIRRTLRRLRRKPSSESVSYTQSSMRSAAGRPMNANEYATSNPDRC